MVGAVDSREDEVGDRPLDYVCSACARSFASKISLGIHRKRQHPVEYNHEIAVAGVKPRWLNEEIRLLALEEAHAPVGTKTMNVYLLSRFPSGRSLEAIKSVRRRGDYTKLVIIGNSCWRVTLSFLLPRANAWLWIRRLDRNRLELGLLLRLSGWNPTTMRLFRRCMEVSGYVRLFSVCWRGVLLRISWISGGFP